MSVDIKFACLHYETRYISKWEAPIHYGLQLSYDGDTGGRVTREFYGIASKRDFYATRTPLQFSGPASISREWAETVLSLLNKPMHATERSVVLAVLASSLARLGLRAGLESKLYTIAQSASTSATDADCRDTIHSYAINMLATQREGVVKLNSKYHDDDPFGELGLDGGGYLKSVDYARSAKRMSSNSLESANQINEKENIKERNNSWGKWA